MSSQVQTIALKAESDMGKCMQKNKCYYMGNRVSKVVAHHKTLLT